MVWSQQLFMEHTPCFSPKRFPLHSLRPPLPTAECGRFSIDQIHIDAETCLFPVVAVNNIPLRLFHSGSLQHFRMWESCWTMQQVIPFSRGSSTNPPVLAFRRCSVLTSLQTSSAVKTPIAGWKGGGVRHGVSPPLPSPLPQLSSLHPGNLIITPGNDVTDDDTLTAPGPLNACTAACLDARQCCQHACHAGVTSPVSRAHQKGDGYSASESRSSPPCFSALTGCQQCRQTRSTRKTRYIRSAQRARGSCSDSSLWAHRRCFPTSFSETPRISRKSNSVLEHGDWLCAASDIGMPRLESMIGGEGGPEQTDGLLKIYLYAPCKRKEERQKKRNHEKMEELKDDIELPFHSWYGRT
ncbi:hypothetical protein PR048_003523 [Dryococelus australis]|uniref:Uncharacterized protein n=1 Tax=Dryococelus australis TaxID=614101 RepID=A0ABQ9IQ81_9NEOP|nr:hypothetical protein PR048_003523 [Dryococelus australis]